MATTSSKTDIDYIKQAAELADGWSIIHIYDGEDWAQLFEDTTGVPSQQILLQDLTKFQGSLAALSAQLVSQVDEKHEFQVISYKLTSYVERCGVDPRSVLTQASYKGRAMNTIRVVVDSKVLKI